MGKIVAVAYVTLDGVFDNPGVWSGPYFNDELAAFQTANLAEADLMLLGRVTYEGFKDAWPKMEEATGDFGKKMNTMPKRVATTTLAEPEWNATFIEGDVVEAVRELRAGSDNVLINGSASLINLLAGHKLIDELRVMTFPLVLGSGNKMWAEGTEAAYTVASSFVTSAGVAVLTYQPA